MIDHNRKFVFIHIPRTGGTSIENAFNYDSKVDNYKFKHLSASQTKSLLTDILWSDYFKMALVRNPFDRMISAWKRGFYENEKSKDLYNFLLNYKPAPHEYESFEYSKILDLPLDYIGKFEELPEVFNYLKTKFDIKNDLPIIEKSNRSKIYQSYYNKKTKAIVTYLHKKDLKKFNYKFLDLSKETRYNLYQYYFYVLEFNLKKKYLTFVNSQFFRKIYLITRSLLNKIGTFL
ncbi:MAG: sulfotransferase family 2 domain-containing protein [Phaeodactylibacter xiamenensis]|uniref:Sulfotransferase family protein n=1 Tax=Phaeodactylibacter xiamenensis TaxID=1524460 RepID=A0A098S397_9BACT|nr:sulfotransferase family 2 domain-containing protein [Phaeodactylibacter xiamenensis]KGE86615.1 hypothetical protein IX84_20195 [Phaeodactylibacter xiamenensis]MCR9053990.1 sulfotransferase family protein [bacterium]